MTRLEANLKIVQILTAYLKQYPDLRFGQALSNLNIATHLRHSVKSESGSVDERHDDIFFKESTATLFDLQHQKLHDLTEHIISKT